MVITVLWAELWFVVERCNLAGGVGIVHILIRVNVSYFRYIEQEREDIFVASAIHIRSQGIFCLSPVLGGVASLSPPDRFFVVTIFLIFSFSYSEKFLYF